MHASAVCGPSGHHERPTGRHGQNQHQSAQHSTPLLVLRLPLKSRHRRHHRGNKRHRAAGSLPSPRALLLGRQAPMRRPTGRLAEIGNNQPSTPRLSSCRDCPSSSVIDAAAHETKHLELPVCVSERDAAGPGAASEVHGRRRSPAAAGCHTHDHPAWAPGGRCWSPSGPIRAVQSPRSCAPMCSGEPRSFSSGTGPPASSTADGGSPPLLAATRASTRPGPPAAVGVRHPGRSAPFKAHGAARPCARASTRPGPTASPR